MFSFQSMLRLAVYQKYPLGALHFLFLAISVGRVVVASPKIVMNLPGTYKKLHCKVNHIGSEVSEILWYRQMDILVL